MKKVIELDHECRDCKGTGLYQGFAEKQGFAVVCNQCKGTGKYHFKYEYEEFTGRKECKDIKRVLECNPGIVVGIIDKFNYESFGGMPYREWALGLPFPAKSEMRNFTCPAWWCQIANYDLKPNWDECWSALGKTFSHCNFFETKDECWKRFDKSK